MDIIEVFKNRRSVRKFKATAVREEDVRQIIWAAHLAPTARNVQPWEFVVVRSERVRRQIAKLSPNGTFIAQSPVCIAIFCADTKYYLEDGSAATTQALLCATALGLGSCWVAGDKKEYGPKVCLLLKAPEKYKLVSLIALGVAAEVSQSHKRDLTEMIHRENF